MRATSSQKSPAVAIGTAAALGFVLVRLIKSGLGGRARSARPDLDDPGAAPWTIRCCTRRWRMRVSPRFSRASIADAEQVARSEIDLQKAKLVAKVDEAKIGVILALVAAVLGSLGARRPGRRRVAHPRAAGRPARRDGDRLGRVAARRRYVAGWRRRQFKAMLAHCKGRP